MIDPEVLEKLENSKILQSKTLTIMICSEHKGQALSVLKEGAHRKRSRKDMEDVKEQEEALKNDRQGALLDQKRIKREHGE